MDETKICRVYEGWVARSKHGKLGLFCRKPFKLFGEWNTSTADLNPKDFPDVTWENSPQEIELKIFKKDEIENVSDGYHTFKELYEYRKLYNAAFFNQLAKEGKIKVCKSRKHSDGELCFGGGWFIVQALLPTGQISNHYEDKDWELFNIPERETGYEYDGHTPQQAAERLRKYLTIKIK